MDLWMGLIGIVFCFFLLRGVIRGFSGEVAPLLGLAVAVAVLWFGYKPLHSAAMLVVAAQSMLDLCENEDIFRLASPVRRGDLIASVGMLLRMGHRLEKYVRPRRSREEESAIREAKALLMDRNGMSEEQAHRFLQKRSMDAGVRLGQAARLVLDG